VTVWTIGHSSRDIELFLSLLRTHGIELVADVRRYPGSRKHPHFNSGPLAETLSNAGIAYRSLTDLGGRRAPRPDSRNTVWRNAAFRGYADHMDTPEFDAALRALIEAAATRRTAVMCSEAVWWRCHRSLIADALKAQGMTVLHILGDEIAEHPYTSAARVMDGRLEYGPAAGELSLFRGLE
jgi:uncharacterized protein (DUF488 family)